MPDRRLRMHVRFYHRFAPGAHGPGGISEVDVVVASEAEWRADPRSKDPAWSVHRVPGRRRTTIVALSLLLPSPDIDIPPPRRAGRRRRN
jgi:hypothetical protein